MTVISITMILEIEAFQCKESMKIHKQTFSTSKVKNRKVTKRIISFLELFFDWKTMFRFMKYAKRTAKHQAIVFAVR